MLAGRPPFVGEHFSGLMLDIMQRDPPPLHTLRTDVPRRLAGVIHRALARDLDRRYPDMPTYIMAVEAVGRDELKLPMGTPAEGLITQLAMPRLTPDGQLPIPKDRRGMQVAIAVGLGLAAAGTWLWIDMRRDQPARRRYGGRGGTGARRRARRAAARAVRRRAAARADPARLPPAGEGGGRRSRGARKAGGRGGPRLRRPRTFAPWAHTRRTGRAHAPRLTASRRRRPHLPS